MDALILNYEGKDVIIPRDELETLGIKPGDRLVVKPEIRLKRREWKPAEWEEMEQLLAELSGSWTEEQEANYRRNKELWSAWKPGD